MQRSLLHGIGLCNLTHRIDKSETYRASHQEEGLRTLGRELKLLSTGGISL
jgi:hypothetical protein